MKFTKFRVVKQFGKYYIEVPFCFFFWTRLTYSKYEGSGVSSFLVKYDYVFENYKEAQEFGVEHQYEVF